MPVLKIFLSNKNLSDEQKQMLVEYSRNYYMTYNKLLLSHFIDFLKILGQLDFFFHGLVLKYMKILKFLGVKKFSYYEILFK